MAIHCILAAACRIILPILYNWCFFLFNWLVKSKRKSASKRWQVRISVFLLIVMFQIKWLNVPMQVALWHCHVRHMLFSCPRWCAATRDRGGAHFEKLSCSKPDAAFVRRRTEWKHNRKCPSENDLRAFQFRTDSMLSLCIKPSSVAYVIYMRTLARMYHMPRVKCVLFMCHICVSLVWR